MGYGTIPTVWYPPALFSLQRQNRGIKKVRMVDTKHDASLFDYPEPEAMSFQQLRREQSEFGRSYE